VAVANLGSVGNAGVTQGGSSEEKTPILDVWGENDIDRSVVPEHRHVVHRHLTEQEQLVEITEGDAHRDKLLKRADELIEMLESRASAKALKFRAEFDLEKNSVDTIATHAAEALSAQALAGCCPCRAGVGSRHLLGKDKHSGRTKATPKQTQACCQGCPDESQSSMPGGLFGETPVATHNGNEHTTTMPTATHMTTPKITPKATPKATTTPTREVTPKATPKAAPKAKPRAALTATSAAVTHSSPLSSAKSSSGSTTSESDSAFLYTFEITVVALMIALGILAAYLGYLHIFHHWVPHKFMDDSEDEETDDEDENYYEDDHSSDTPGSGRLPRKPSVPEYPPPLASTEV